MNVIEKDFMLQLFMSYDKQRTMPKDRKAKIEKAMARVVKLLKGN